MRQVLVIGIVAIAFSTADSNGVRGALETVMLVPRAAFNDGFHRVVPIIALLLKARYAS